MGPDTCDWRGDAHERFLVFGNVQRTSAAVFSIRGRHRVRQFSQLRIQWGQLAFFRHLSRFDDAHYEQDLDDRCRRLFDRTECDSSE